MQKLLLPLILIITLVIENVFVLLFSGKLFGGNLIIVPHFVLIALIFLAIFVNYKYALLYGAGFGLIYDVIYTEILGVYLFLFPVIVYLIGKLMLILYKNIVVSVIMALVGVALIEIVVYEINFLIGFTDYSFVYYWDVRLLPTLILNLIFLIISCYIYKRAFEKFTLHLEKE